MADELESLEFWLCMQVVKTLNERISKYCEVTLETMAYAGTGDVLMVQKMLSIVGEHIEVEDTEKWKVTSPFCQPLHFLLEYAVDAGVFLTQNLCSTYSAVHRLIAPPLLATLRLRHTPPCTCRQLTLRAVDFETMFVNALLSVTSLQISCLA